ncbi:hypothetical protein TcWFU_004503 [Taenia crassiceps]|uniref:DUF5727 domain-containing protein n=1 Tax=Taenia crassiceps TaxID=6207 RepID=A0ABR4Q339_9CEST
MTESRRTGEGCLLSAVSNAADLSHSHLPFATENLTRDAESHLRLFSGKFQRMEAHDVYEWQGVNDRLAVTVDWTQSGESPEFEECQMQKAEWRSKCRAEVRSEAER